MFRTARKIGPLRAAILDWSGTVTDRYVIAPACVFQKVFAAKDVPISMEEAREPMGLRKDLHIEAITQMDGVRERWGAIHGGPPTQTDVQDLFEAFVPAQIEVLPDYANIIPGTRRAINRLRNGFNLKIGMTTGFTRPMVNVLLKHLKAQGFEPDVDVAGDEVYHGARPGPFMIYKNLDKLGILPIQSVVKVDDTVGGIGEGLNAGCWTVGVSKYSNYMNIDSYEHEQELTPAELDHRNRKSREILEKAGAHYVVDSIADLPEVCRQINWKLEKGVRP